ncbi:peptidoglycan/LPS O-acetylase OafA/YrhL [Thioclava sp. ES.031]|nr:acyltransferase family protein [Thioclava sp. ES.031]PFG63170.1 peptidoglycan/LPS O-acetylase OafA/YrhL [Thioclava sp. ES.031]
MGPRFGVARSLHSDKYRPDIDGLRALAVISVVITHAFPRLWPAGFIGVDIFFVISGYLISTILMRDLAEGRYSIARFYQRRILRIFPALIVVLAAIFAIGWYLQLKGEFASLLKHILASIFFSENLLLWSEASYFDISSVFKPTLHFWSLAVEEQFYIVWPLLLAFVWRGRGSLPLVLAGLTLASFVYGLFETYRNPTAAYYSPFARGWELLIGAGLAYLKRHHAALTARHTHLQSLIGAGLIAVAFIFMEDGSPFPGWWALFPVLGAALLISAGSEGMVNKYLLSLRIPVWIGVISYPLYLWHWVFLSYMHITFRHVYFKMGLVAIVLSLIAAWATFRFVELPIRRKGRDRDKTLALGVAMGGLAGLVLLAALIPLPPRFRIDLPMPDKTEWSFLLSKVDAPKPNETDIYQLGPESAQEVLFIGDSHVAQYATRIEKLVSAGDEPIGATLAIGSGCAPIPEIKTDDPNRAPCRDNTVNAWRLASLPRYHTVVIGGAWNFYAGSPAFYVERADARVPLVEAPGRRAALSRLAESVRELSAAGKSVFVLLDNPRLQDFTNIAPEMRLGWGPVSDARALLREQPIPAKDKALTEEMKNVLAKSQAVVIDPAFAFCSEDHCRVREPDLTTVYKDNNHFNPDWVAQHARFLDSIFAK